jgi:hypothetical protein
MDYLQYPRWKGERATLAMAGEWVSFRFADHREEILST